MGQRRLLVAGAVLIAAGIVTPTTAMLMQGGAQSEPPTPFVEATTPAPDLPLDVPVEMTPPVVVPSEAVPTSAPPRVRTDTEVPSHLGSGNPPPRRPAAVDPTDVPAPADPPPTPRTAYPQVDEPSLATVESRPADPGGLVPSVAPPPALPADDQDPADQ